MKWNLSFRVLHNMMFMFWFEPKPKPGVREGEKGGVWHTFPTPQMFFLADWSLNTKKQGPVQPIPTFCHLIWSLRHDENRIAELKAEHLQCSKTQYCSMALKDCLLYKLTSTAAHLGSSTFGQQPCKHCKRALTNSHYEGKLKIKKKGLHFGFG